MKKFILGWVVGLAMMLTLSVYAEDGLEKVEAYLRPGLLITLDNQPITLENSPVMYNGNTYLRLRDVSALTGLFVNWDEETQTVVLSTTEPVLETPPADGGVTVPDAVYRTKDPEVLLMQRINKMTTQELEQEIVSVENELGRTQWGIDLLTDKNGSQSSIDQERSKYNERESYLNKLKARKNELEAAQ